MCETKTLCGVNDVGKLKGLTNKDFLQLGLYGKTYNDSTLDPNQANEQFRRLRVRCIGDGKHRLEACPRNMILEKKEQKMNYNVCAVVVAVAAAANRHLENVNEAEVEAVNEVAAPQKTYLANVAEVEAKANNEH